MFLTQAFKVPIQLKEKKKRFPKTWSSSYHKHSVMDSLITWRTEEDLEYNSAQNYNKIPKMKEICTKYKITMIVKMKNIENTTNSTKASKQRTYNLNK